MTTLNDGFLNIILDEEVSDELFNIMFGEVDELSPIFQRREAAFLLFRNNLAYLGIAGYNYRQALVVNYISNLLTKLTEDPSFWDSLATYLRNQPFVPLPNNIKGIDYSPTSEEREELRFIYNRDWLLEQRFNPYRIGDTEIIQNRRFFVGNIELTFQKPTKTKKISDFSSSQTKQFEYAYTAGLLAPEIFTDGFYKEVYVQRKIPTNFFTIEEQSERAIQGKDNEVFLEKKIVLQKIKSKQIAAFNELNSFILSSQLKILAKPDFLNNTIQAILALDFTNVGYKPILSINSILKT